MSESARHYETAWALEIILSRLRLDRATSDVLQDHLRHTREAFEHSEAEARKLASEGPWPHGCIKQISCARNKACMYGCRHKSRNIASELEPRP